MTQYMEKMNSRLFSSLFYNTMTTTVRREPNPKSLSSLKSSSYIIGAFCLVGVIYWVLASLGLFGSNVKGKQSKQGEKSQGKKNASKTPVTKKAQASPGLKESTEILPNSAKGDKTSKERLSPNDKAPKPIVSQREKPKDKKSPPVPKPIDTIPSKAQSSSPSPPPSLSPSPPPSSLPSLLPSPPPSSSPSPLPSSSPSPPKTTKKSNIITKTEIDNKKADDVSPEKRSPSDERSSSAIKQKETPKERENSTDSSSSKVLPSSLPSPKATKNPNTTEKIESESENTGDGLPEEKPLPTEASDLLMNQQKSPEKLSFGEPLKLPISEKVEESSKQETTETHPSQPLPSLNSNKKVEVEKKKVSDGSSTRSSLHETSQQVPGQRNPSKKGVLSDAPLEPAINKKEGAKSFTQTSADVSSPQIPPPSQSLSSFPSLSMSKTTEESNVSKKAEIESEKLKTQISEEEELKRLREEVEWRRKKSAEMRLIKETNPVIIKLEHELKDLRKVILQMIVRMKYQETIDNEVDNIMGKLEDQVKDLMERKQDSSNKDNLLLVGNTVAPNVQCISVDEYLQPEDREINFLEGLNLTASQFKVNFLMLIFIKINELYDNENLRYSRYITDDMVVKIREKFVPLLSEDIYEEQEWDNTVKKWVVVPGPKRTTDKAVWAPILERVLVLPSHIKFFEPKMSFELYKSLVMTHVWYLRLNTVFTSPPKKVTHVSSHD